jgi:hypothetical protein
MAILINPATATNHDDYYDEVDPTWIILSLAVSISIFPFIVAMVFVAMNHYYLPPSSSSSSWAAKTMFFHYYPLSSLFSSGRSSSSSSSGRNNNSNTTNTSQRGRRASINGTGSTGRHVKKTTTTTMARTTTTTLRDLLTLYQGLLSAGYLAFPMWMIYHHSVGNTNNGGDGKEGLAVGSSSEGGGGGVYSFVAILTVMGIICHNVRGKISSSYYNMLHPPRCCAAVGDC